MKAGQGASNSGDGVRLPGPAHTLYGFGHANFRRKGKGVSKENKHTIH